MGFSVIVCVRLEVGEIFFCADICTLTPYRQDNVTEIQLQET